MKRFLCVLGAVFAVVWPGAAVVGDGVPGSISYQGKLTDAAGQAVPDSTYQVQFKLYTVETEGTAFWTSAAKNVQTRGGLFTTEISPITPGDLSGKTDVWLETWVALPPAEPAALSPRVKLGSVAFALRAGDLVMPFSGATSGSGPAFTITNSGTGPAIKAEGTYAGEFLGKVYVNGNVGIGTSGPAFPLDVNGVIRSSTGGFQFPDGTTQTTAGTTGTGTTSYIPRWTGAGTLGDSLIFQDGDRVGIGTTSVSHKLDVHAGEQHWLGLRWIVDSGPEAGAFALFDSNNARGALTLGRPGDSGKLWSTTGGWQWGNQLNIMGNVGIGTASPSSALEVAGQVKITGGDPGAGKVLTSDAAGLASWATPAPTGVGGSGTDNYIPRWSGTGSLESSVVYQGDDGNIGIGTTSPSAPLQVSSPLSTGHIVVTRPLDRDWKIGVNGGLFLQDGLTDKGLFIQNVGGWVGIGTTSPAAELDVNGQVSIRGGGPGEGKVLTSDASGLASWQTPASGMPSGSSGQTVRHDGAAWVANNTIYNDGSSVGIGTTSPSAKLEVAGQVKITGGDPGAGKVLASDATGLASWTTPASGMPSGTSGQTLRHDGSSWVANSAIYNDGSAVGIGTTTPRGPLEVYASSGDIWRSSQETRRRRAE